MKAPCKDDELVYQLELLAPTVAARLRARREVDLIPASVAAQAGLDPERMLRCFPTEDALLAALVLGAYNGMSDAAEAGAATARAASSPVLQVWTAVCLSVRGWAIAHPDEYTLIWGQPVPSFVAPGETMAAGARTVQSLLATLREADEVGQLAEQPEDPPMTDGMAANVRALSEGLLSGLPDEIIARMLIAWTQLHGMIGFEVNGHISGVAGDPAAFFEYAANQLGHYVGLPR